MFFHKKDPIYTVQVDNQVDLVAQQVNFPQLYSTG